MVMFFISDPSSTAYGLLYWLMVQAKLTQKCRKEEEPKTPQFVGDERGAGMMPTYNAFSAPTQTNLWARSLRPNRSVH
jgi:hypothetical protein